MNEILERPPKTIMDVFRMLPEGTLAELIKGKLFMSPSPIKSHQVLVGRLFAEMARHVEEAGLGEVYIAPFDVYLDEQANVVQPDIIFVGKDNMSIVKDHIHGVPDLLVEVLSPGGKSHDLKTKKSLYEKYGVREYWVIDPITKESSLFSLDAMGKYSSAVHASGKLKSKLLRKTFVF